MAEGGGRAGRGAALSLLTRHAGWHGPPGGARAPAPPRRRRSGVPVAWSQHPLFAPILQGGMRRGAGGEAAACAGKQRGLGDGACEAVISALDWSGAVPGCGSRRFGTCGTAALPLCSWLAAVTGVGSRARCCGCAAYMHVDARDRVRLRGRSSEGA